MNCGVCQVLSFLQSKNMAFSSWIACLRSCSKSNFINALRSSSHLQKSWLGTQNAPTVAVVNAGRTDGSFSLWSISLLPLALAASLSSLAVQTQSQPSLCEDSGAISIGGKGSTEFVVKGFYKEVPQELIDELKTICQDNMAMDYDERFFHGKPQHIFHRAINIPDVVVF